MPTKIQFVMELFAHSESIYRIYNRAGTPVNAYMHDVLYTGSHQTVTAAAAAFTILLDTIWSIDSIELYFLLVPTIVTCIYDKDKSVILNAIEIEISE